MEATFGLVPMLALPPSLSYSSWFTSSCTTGQNEEHDRKSRMLLCGFFVCVKVCRERSSAFTILGLERQGGIMVYDLTKPTKPKFNSYFSSRVFHGGDVTEVSGDVTPEAMTFISTDNSRTGEELLLAAHEVSSTIAAYGLGVTAKNDKLPESSKAKGKSFLSER